MGHLGNGTATFRIINTGMGLFSLHVDLDDAGTLTGRQHPIFQPGRFKSTEHFRIGQLLLEHLGPDRASYFLVTVEDEYDFLVRQEARILHDLDSMDGYNDAALAVRNSQTVCPVLFHMEWMPDGIAFLEDGIRMGIQNDFARRMLRFQPATTTSPYPGKCLCSITIPLI